MDDMIDLEIEQVEKILAKIGHLPLDNKNLPEHHFLNFQILV